MKVEFELSIDEYTHIPKIKFKHYDKNYSVDQMLIKIFVSEAKQKGIELVNPSSFTDGTINSFEDYEIKIKKIC